MKVQKVEHLVANLLKLNMVIHIRNLKQPLNNGLVFKKVHEGIKFNQNVWLIPFIEINTELREKVLMHEFWYDYIKPKYCEKAKLCYMDADSFVLYIKTDNTYEDISEDVETRFNSSNCELDSSLTKVKDEKIIGLM